MTVSEYARHCGVSHQAVSMWLARGHIEREPNGRIDPAKCDPKVAALRAKLRKPADDDDVKRKTRLARMRREQEEARLAKLKRLSTERQLVNLSDVMDEVFTIARSTRNALLAIPDGLSLALAAETDPTKVRLLLVLELTAVLDRMATQLESTGSGDGDLSE